LTLDRHNLAAGLVFIALGGLFLFFSRDLEMGTAFRMGPAYFPRVLAGLLIALGAAIALQRGEGGQHPPFTVPWRGVVLILSAPILFGLSARGLGLGPAVALITFLAAFASRKMTVPTALAIALGLAVFCVLVFKVGLAVRLPIIGPWLGF